MGAAVQVEVLLGERRQRQEDGDDPGSLLRELPCGELGAVVVDEDVPLGGGR